MCVAEARTIVVQGGALANAKSENSLSTDIVALTDRPAERVENALRELPNVQQFRRSDARSSNPTSQGITLRGIGGNASSRAALLLDGVPQADPFGGWIAWPGYDALPLHSARVTRGGGSVGAGPGAVAGTIHLFSADPGNSLDLTAGYGSRSSFEAKAALGRELGDNGQLTFSASYARGDGFVPTIESQRGAVDRPAPFEQAGAALRLVAPLDAQTEVQANLRAFTDQRDRGFAFSDNANSGADASLRLVGRGTWQWSALVYGQLREFSSRFASIADDRSSAVQVLDQFAVPSTGVGARAELRPPVHPNVELRIGGDWRRVDGETQENFFFQNGVPGRSRRAGGTSDTIGGFAELSWDVSDHLLLTGGGRIDFWSIDGGFRREIELINPFPGAVRSDDIFGDRSGEEFTAQAGFAFRVAPEWALRGSAYLGWRLPTLNELYRPFRVGADATAANELLAPERLKGAEIGVEFDAGDRSSFALNGFYNRLEAAIANVTLGRGPGVFPGVGFVSGAGVFRQRLNVDAIDSYGIEAQAKFDLTDRLSLSAAYSFVDATVHASGSAPALDGQRPAQVAQHSGLAELAWQDSDDRGSAALTLRYVGPQFEDDLGSERLADALTLDARGEWRLAERLALFARVENLFDREIQAGISGDGIIERASPRTIWFGLRVRIE
jgi:outer membrane receptor protein involved in Fe transport